MEFVIFFIFVKMEIISKPFSQPLTYKTWEASNLVKKYLRTTDKQLSTLF